MMRATAADKDGVLEAAVLREGRPEGDLQVSPEKAQALAGMTHKQAFGHAMARIAAVDPTLSVVVSDYGRRLNLDGVRDLLPSAVVQCGIAEQNQVEVASALANEGLTTFAVSYATFVTSRVLDQVRVALGMMGAPVVVVGVSCGCDSGILGASHMALEDIGCMRQIPGVTVVSPTDNAEFVAALLELAAHPRPAYVRMSEPLTGGLHPGGVCAGIGWAEVLLDVEAPRVVLVATGTVAAEALAAGRELVARGVPCRVVSQSTIKPFDLSAFDGAVGADLVVSVEEHSVVGGLGGAVAEEMSAMGGMPPLLRLGMPDRYLEADTRDRLLERAGLTAPGIVAAVQGRLAGGR